MTSKVTDHFMIIMLVGLLKLTQFLLGSACHVVGPLISDHSWMVFASLRAACLIFLWHSIYRLHSSSSNDVEDK